MTATTLEVGGERLPGLWERQLDTGEIVDVNFPKRMIELVVIPYDTEAQVPHPTRLDGPMVAEVIGRGAFDGIEKRPNRIKANREHQVLHTFGKCRALYPSRENGLVAEVEVRNTPLGDETLELASGGCLEASAGFSVKPGGWHWETRGSRYRVDTAWLRHVSLVSEGAYGEAAPVLAVRTQPAMTAEQAAMPRLSGYLRDQRLAEYRAQEAAMDARWQVRPPGR
jgi:HK97 family phage prohead protease